MDAVKFLKERERMCRYYMQQAPCSYNECPMNSLRVKLQEDGPKKVLCSSVLYKQPDEAVTLVEAWSKGHPVKTRKMDFLEKYPGALLDSRGVPRGCARFLGYTELCPGGCDKCWETPLEGG